MYDHDIRIPMVASGPGIKPDTEFALPASNVDVGPTFLGLAGVDAPGSMDGRSVVPLIVDEGHVAVSAATRAHIERERASASEWRDHHCACGVEARSLLVWLFVYACVCVPTCTRAGGCRYREPFMCVCVCVCVFAIHV